MAENSIQRLWKPIELTSTWLDSDTSTIDDLAPSWFDRREILQNNSQEYKEFIDELKREHAIETGIVERMYDLEKGITETFIKKGFVDSYVSHNETNIPVPKLIAHLTDHLNAVDMVFDVVKHNRELTIGFIHELHSLVTRNQEFAEGRDQFGRKTQIPLLKGKFKELENNPTRDDGTKIEYCPPVHVPSEMDNLLAIYGKAENEGIHFLICATWFHHAFTTIHPYQDGNGRVARLLASLILIKHKLFPFTVLREEAKARYVDALEKADSGHPQELVTYFAEVQKRHIEKALNLREVASSSFSEVAKIFSQRLGTWKTRQIAQRQELLEKARERVFEFCLSSLSDIKSRLEAELKGNAHVSIRSSPPSDKTHQNYYYGQIVKYTKEHNYYLNVRLPRAWITFRIEFDHDKKYQLGITLHHYGYDDTTLAIGAFLEFLIPEDSGDMLDRLDKSLPLDLPPHVLSIYADIDSKEKNISAFLDHAVTLTLAQIASELPA